MPDQPILFFVHIRKTAGTTLRRIIRRQFPRGTVLESDDDTFPHLTPEQWARMRAFQGHVPFGAHPPLPRAASYITLLRDPVERALSFYHYVRRLPRHPLHATAHSASVGDFYQAIAEDAANYQTRYLSGRLDDSSPDTLPLALHNLLHRATAFGIQERFDESVLLFRRRLGWGSVRYARENVARGRPGPRDYPAREIRSIERINELDLELYARATDHFDAAVQELGSSFQQELRAFRRRNAVYAAVAGTAHQAYLSLPGTVRNYLRRAIRTRGARTGD